MLAGTSVWRVKRGKNDLKAPPPEEDSEPAWIRKQNNKAVRTEPQHGKVLPEPQLNSEIPLWQNLNSTV